MRTEVAALLMIEGVVAEVEAVATKWVQDQLARFAVEIKNTTGATRDAYLKVKEQTSTPESTDIELTTTLKAPTKGLEQSRRRGSPHLQRPPVRRPEREVPGKAQ